MSRPRVSIIVPIYNAERYLEQCLFSLKEQTLTDIEVIMCDNASTDGSLAIIRNFAEMDPRFFCVEHKDNIGQGGNMKSGLAAAKGEYIAECDADDFADPRMYKTLYDYARRFYCEVVQCGWFDYSQRSITARPITCYDSLFDQRTLGRFDRGLFLAFQPHIMSCIYRREWIVQNDLWYRANTSYEDTSLTFKHRAMATRYGIVKDCLYYYRKDNATAGTFTCKDVYGINEQYKEIDRFDSEHGLLLGEYISMMRYYTYRWQFQRLDYKQKPDFFRKCSEEFKKGCPASDLFSSPTDYADYMLWKQA